MKAEQVDKYVVMSLIADATHFAFKPGIDMLGQPTAEAIPDNTVLVQYLRATPGDGLITVSPANDLEPMSKVLTNGQYYRVQHAGKPPENAHVNTKTAKKKLLAVAQEADKSVFYEAPATITLAIPIDQPQEQTISKSSKAKAICKVFHSADKDVLEALRHKAETILGITTKKTAFDPFEL